MTSRDAMRSGLSRSAAVSLMMVAALGPLVAQGPVAHHPVGAHHDPGPQTTDTTTQTTDASTPLPPTDTGGHHKGGDAAAPAPPPPAVLPTGPAPRVRPRSATSRPRRPALRQRRSIQRSTHRRHRPFAPNGPAPQLTSSRVIDSVVSAVAGAAKRAGSGTEAELQRTKTAAARHRRSSGRRGPVETPVASGPERRPRDTVSQPLVPEVVRRIESVIPPIVWWLIVASVAAVVGSAGVAALVARRARRQAAALASAHAAATTDPLTGVLNRRGFIAEMNRELDRARRHHHSFAVAYLDVRNFKQVNDAHGHEAGDRLLQGVARLLTETARHHDLVGRLGGDELALLLVEQSASGSAIVLDRVRAAVAQLRRELGLATAWDLTVGVAEFPGDGEGVAELMKVADRRLYEQRGIVLR